MAFDDELKFEKELVHILQEQHGWKDGVLYNPDEEELKQNWADILYRNNNTIDKLNGVPLSKDEMKRIMDQVQEARTPFALNQFINGREITVQRDSDSEDKLHAGKEIALKIYDRLEIATGKSIYQIVRQPKFPCRDEIYPQRRGDLLLLINGMPVYHIELKKSGVPISQATNQIQKYAHEGVYTNTLFSLVQIFVAMNPEDMVYFANPGPDGKFNEKFFFHWEDWNNEKRTNEIVYDYKFISSHFLNIPMAHQMVGWYTVADKTDGILKVMRSYQYHAANAIGATVAKHDWSNNTVSVLGILGGFVWHTTGSGKTMTSYKSAQLVADMHLSDKVIFLVDRIELGTQSLEQYRNFADAKTEVQATENTHELVTKLKSKDVKDTLIVTSIQKASELKNEVSEKDLEEINKKKIVFIIDECHRSTFGTMMSDIRKTFIQTLYFGFTGTPIHEENNKKESTTSDLFGNELHRYSIGDGIRDENVLGFDPIQCHTYDDNKLRQAVALEKAKALNTKEAYSDEKKKKVFMHYMNPKEVSMCQIENLLPSSQYDRDEHRNAIVDNILENWTVRSVNDKYHAIFATNSIPEAIEYYKIFKKRNSGLNVTALFDPSDNNNNGSMGKIQGVHDILLDYKNMYGKSFTIPTYASFKKDIQLRLAHKDPYISIEKEPEKQINILIVVDQLLTGYDSKWVNTLYLDKEMKYEGLIQAFSRTNRLDDEDKPHGTICYYRKPNIMQKNIEDAFRLYAGEQAFYVFVYKLEENVKEMNRIADEIKSIFENDGIEDFSEAPKTEAGCKKFVKLFNEYNKKYEAARIQGFEFGKPLPDKTIEEPTDRIDEDGNVIYEVKTVKANPPEANISSVTFSALKQRYIDIAGGNGGETKNTPEAPYDIKAYLTEIRTGLIDTEYMNSKFTKFLKALNEEESEEIQKAIKELHQTFGTLTPEEQTYANVFIQQVQSGEVKPDSNKTLRDYITEYMVNDRNKEIHLFSDNFGVNEQALINLLQLDLNETNLDDYGRFTNLIETVNEEKAQEYFQKKENVLYEGFELNIKIDEELRNFLLNK